MRERRVRGDLHEIVYSSRALSVAYLFPQDRGRREEGNRINIKTVNLDAHKSRPSGDANKDTSDFLALLTQSNNRVASCHGHRQQDRGYVRVIRATVLATPFKRCAFLREGNTLLYTRKNKFSVDR